MGISDTSCMMDGLPLLYWHRIWASLGKAGITKIAYDFRKDRTTAQLCSWRQRIN